MAQLTVVYWRDIPAQVIAEHGRGRARRRARAELPERFAKAIDAAAMKAGAADTDRYLSDWRRSDPVACSDDLEAAVQAEAERLSGLFDAQQLASLVRNGGWPAG